MSNKIKFTIDGKECYGEKGQLLLDAAEDNGVYIPSLCHLRGVEAAGSCRICNVKINGRLTTACTAPLTDDMTIENETEEINNIRSAIVEALFVEGNHFCPACEKSGNCELQALGYKYKMLVPRYPYAFPYRDVDATTPNIYLETNRCVFCKRCIRKVKVDDKNVFAFKNRGNHLDIAIDHELAAKMTEEQTKEAMDCCPVGAILEKERGFNEPIGSRKFDKEEIGSNIKCVL